MIKAPLMLGAHLLQLYPDNITSSAKFNWLPSIIQRHRT